jgi:GNAT superfamily N-acetyltransferase
MYRHAFDPHQDVKELQAFLAEMRRQVAQAAYFQFGDLVWRMSYAPNRFDQARDIRVWDHKDGRLAGFVFYFGPDENSEFFLQPELYDKPVADEMVSWAMARGAAGNASFIETSCIEGDTAKADFLTRAGFELYGDVMVFMERDLDDVLPDDRLPEGYSIVSGADRPDLPSVTGRPLTHEAYQAVRHAPGYKDDLGLRVCYQDREIVSGCICWYDDLDTCGEFEPVGTSEEHRRKGLASAVMARTIKHLRRYDADVVYVRAVKDNVPAVHLYQKLGFRITNEDYGWRRPV